MLLDKSFTRLTVAVSIAALFCAALCPMTCALSFCPGQSHDSPAQDCGHSSPDPGSASYPQTPGNSGCTAHHGLADNLVKPSSPAQFHVIGAASVHTSFFLFAFEPAAPVNPNTFAHSDSAAPINRTSPLYGRPLALRI
jgi:hypothetical protein